MSPFLLKILFAILISLVAKCSAHSASACPPRVLLFYKAQWCSVCPDAEKYLISHGVRFEPIDIDKHGLSRWAWAMGGIPIFDFGNGFVRGFNPRELDRRLCTY